jgi:hypothetical protein
MVRLLGAANLIPAPTSQQVASAMSAPNTAVAQTPDVDLKAARQQQAANARAAKANKAQQQQTRVSGGVQAPPLDVAGTNGAAGDQDDDLGLDAPGMSPGEAKEAGLALVREAYAAGHVKQVKELQKEFNVAKFYDVPVENGHVFYQRVMKMAQGVGIRQ